MGAKLLEFYQQAQESAGLQGRIKLAMITKLSQEKAKEAADSPKNIQLFADAVKKIQAE